MSEEPIRSPESGARAPGPGERDNACRWDFARRGHYEVWYLTFNHRESETGFWIRYTLEAPLDGHGDPYAQLWFAMFDARDPSRTFGINRVLPIGELAADDAPVAVRIGDSQLTHQSASGRLAGAGHEARWDLAWIPAETTHRQLPPVMYARGGLGETTVLTPNVDVLLRGEVEVDGRRLEIAGEPGGQTHLWGRKHARRWAWGHCNAFASRPGAALETLTACIRRGGVDLPPLTVLTLYLDGEALRWNQLWHTPLTRGQFGTAHYRFRARKPGVLVEGEYACRPQDMVVAPYADPDGEPAWCANTEIADLRVTVWRRGVTGRWREHAHLVAPRAGHFEIGGRRRDPDISKDHVTLDDRPGPSPS